MIRSSWGPCRLIHSHGDSEENSKGSAMVIMQGLSEALESRNHHGNSESKQRAQPASQECLPFAKRRVRAAVHFVGCIHDELSLPVHDCQGLPPANSLAKQKTEHL